jgi:hypothetical protein
MQIFNINRNSLGIIAVKVIAAAIFMIVVPLLDRPAVADQSAAAPTRVRQQSPDDALQDFADRMALDRRLQRLEQQVQTLSNATLTIVPQQPPIADHPQDFADRIGLDQRLQRLELQIQTLLNIQIEILLNTRNLVATTIVVFCSCLLGPMGTSSPTCTQPSRRANTCKVVPRGTVRNTAEPVGTSRMFAPWPSSYSDVAVGAVNGAVPRSTHGTDAGQPDAFVIPDWAAGLGFTLSPARALPLGRVRGSRGGDIAIERRRGNPEAVPIWVTPMTAKGCPQPDPPHAVQWAIILDRNQFGKTADWRVLP